MIINQSCLNNTPITIEFFIKAVTLCLFFSSNVHANKNIDTVVVSDINANKQQSDYYVSALESETDNAVAVPLANATAGAAASTTEWTMGIGMGVFQYHLYPGAINKDLFILPVPYFTFRSPRFEIDRGIKSFLIDTDEFVIDISADFGLPVDSSDTQARKGMPDLDFVVQVGPSIEFLLTDKNSSYFDTRFEIPARVAYVIDGKNSRNIGYLLEPRFSFNHRRNARTGISQKATLGVKFATEDFHSYYYDVDPQFVVPGRSSYKSSAGFGGSFAKYRISYKTNDFVYWTFLRYQSLRGAVFEDSPLVINKDYYLVGIGFAWIFANSL